MVVSKCVLEAEPHLKAVEWQLAMTSEKKKQVRSYPHFFMTRCSLRVQAFGLPCSVTGQLKALLSLLKAAPSPKLKSPSHHCNHAGAEIGLCCGLVLAVGLCVFQSGSLLPGEVFGWSLLFSAFELSEVCLGPSQTLRENGEGWKVSSFAHVKWPEAGE